MIVVHEEHVSWGTPTCKRRSGLGLSKEQIRVSVRGGDRRQSLELLGATYSCSGEFGSWYCDVE